MSRRRMTPAQRRARLWKELHTLYLGDTNHALDGEGRILPRAQHRKDIEPTGIDKHALKSILRCSTATLTKDIHDLRVQAAKIGFQIVYDRRPTETGLTRHIYFFSRDAEEISGWQEERNKTNRSRYEVDAATAALLEGEASISTEVATQVSLDEVRIPKDAAA